MIFKLVIGRQERFEGLSDERYQIALESQIHISFTRRKKEWGHRADMMLRTSH